MMHIFLKLFKQLFKLPLSRTAKDTYWVFAGNIFSSFLAFIYTIFLARRFSPPDFGIFSAVCAYMMLVADVCDLGIGSSLSRFLPPLIVKGEEEKSNSFTKTAFLFLARISFVVFVLTIVFSDFLSQFLLKNKEYSLLFILSGFGIVGTVFLAFVTYTLSAQKKFPAVSIINTLSTLVKLILVVVFFYIGFLNIKSAFFAFIISSFVAYFFSLRFLPLTFLKERQEKGNFVKLLSFSLYLGASRIFSAIGSRLDALLLIPLSSSFEAGLYSAAFKMASLYIILASSFSMVIAPRLSSFAKIGETLSYMKKVILASLGIIITMVILYLIAPWFVIFVLGKEYALSVSVFQALLLPMAFFTLTIAPVSFLIYTLKKPQISTLNTFVQLIIILIGNTFLIPRFGRFGPVITLSFVYGFTFISATLFSVYYFKKRKYA